MFVNFSVLGLIHLMLIPYCILSTDFVVSWMEIDWIDCQSYLFEVQSYDDNISRKFLCFHYFFFIFNLRNFVTFVYCITAQCKYSFP